MGLCEEKPRSRASYGLRCYLRNGIYRYHKTGEATAGREHLEAGLERAKEDGRLTNDARIAAALDAYDRYVPRFERLGVNADARVEIALPAGAADLRLGGYVHRVDFLNDGLRGVLLGAFGDDWETELRFPLLQAAVSRTFGVPLADVSVGVQGLDGRNLRSVAFSAGDVDRARGDFKSLAVRLHELGYR
jgi:hypothetical protein